MAAVAEVVHMVVQRQIGLHLAAAVLQFVYRVRHLT
jgi:hypothetical protein